MKKRTLSSILIVLVLIGFFFLRSIDYRLFDILSYGVAICCTFELLKAFKEDFTKLQKVLIMLFTLTVFPFARFFTAYLPQFVVAFTAVIIFATILTVSLEKKDNLFKVVFATFYPTVPLLALVLINVRGNAGLFYLITALAIPCFTDVGAYLIGSLVKGPKLIESISPNKTVSGAVGGLICGVIASLLTYFVLNAFKINVFVGKNIATVVIFLVVSGIFLSVVTQVGDLTESYLKRLMGIKDMGSIIPGHGGMLDRVDGIAFTALFVYVLYSVVL